ncbi:hypothetical protein BJV74DRAFT_537666 [Russula compacta]|nr:hypothetical protein BJV74DRAFT_537666 [Russula compacta]
MYPPSPSHSLSDHATPALRAETKKQSEQAAYHGHRAKTPIISAIVCSAVLVTIWTLIFLAWLWKQYKKRVRAKRRAAKGLPPKVKKPKKPPPTFILPPDPAVITGQREPGERAIPKKHNSIDKHTPNAFELNERTRPVTEGQIHDEMIARQVFSKRSALDPPKHEKRGSHQPPPRSPTG